MLMAQLTEANEGGKTAGKEVSRNVEAAVDNCRGLATVVDIDDFLGMQSPKYFYPLVTIRVEDAFRRPLELHPGEPASAEVRSWQLCRPVVSPAKAGSGRNIRSSSARLKSCPDTKRSKAEFPADSKGCSTREKEHVVRKGITTSSMPWQAGMNQDTLRASMPSFFMREIRVVRLRPRRAAAPSGPATRPFVSLSTRRISSRSP